MVSRPHELRLHPRVSVGLRGEIELAKFGRDGQRLPVRVDRNKRAWQRVWEHRQPNLILNSGMDFGWTHVVGGSTFPKYQDMVRYVAVGTGTATPAVTDLALGNELARTEATLALGVWQTLTVPTEGVGQLRSVRAFDFGEANGNLTEFGGSNSGVALGGVLTRGLFVDELDNPIVITKTSDEQLRVTYDLFSNVSGPTVMTPTTDLTFTGFGAIQASWMQYRAAAGTPDTRTNFSDAGGFRGLWNWVSPVASLTAVGGMVTTSNPGGVSPSVQGTGNGAYDTYIGGSYQNVWRGTFPTSASDNVAEGLYFASQGAGTVPHWGWLFTNPATFTKEAEYRLLVNFTVATSRV